LKRASKAAGLTSDALADVRDRPEKQLRHAAWREREQIGSEWIAASLVLLASFGYLCIFRRYVTMEPDEGIVLVGAERILRGQVLYRDFFSFLTPGSYYFVALQLRFLGDSITAARTALAAAGGFFSLFTYLLARRVCSRRVSVTAAGLVTVTCLPFRFLVLHNWDSTLWACAAVYCALRLIESQPGAALTSAWAFATGLFAAFTLLSEQSKGAGLLLGIGAGLLAVALLAERRYLFTAKPLAAMVLGFVWPLAATLFYFAAHGALAPMLADWVWPLRHYAAANRVFYGYQNFPPAVSDTLLGSSPLAMKAATLLVLSPCFLLPVLPLLAVPLLVYWVARARRVAAPPEIGAYYLLMNAVLCGLLVSIVLGRADILHFVYLEPLLVLVLAWAMAGRDIPGALFRSIRVPLMACVAGAFLALGIPLAMRATQSSTHIETRRGAVWAPANDTVIPYVQQHVAEGGEMLSYPYLPLYNYLTDTHSPAQLDYFQPGMHTREQASDMIASLEAHPTSVVLLESAFAEKIARAWPETPLEAIANDPIADFILSRYHPCRTLVSASEGRFEYMVRRELTCSEHLNPDNEFAVKRTF